MKVLKRFFQKSQKPELAPCEHELTLFPAKDGRRVTILMAPQKLESTFVSIPGAVWCGDGCGWVKITDDQHQQYRARNGFKKA